MSAIAMRDAVVAKYGKDSHEAGYIQFVFARRPLEYLKFVYEKLMKKA